MSYTLDWLIEGHVVLVRSGETVEPDNIPNLDQELMGCLDQLKGQLLHVIYDIRQTQVKPDLKNATRMRHVKDPRMGWSCIVEEFNLLISFVITLAAKILKSRFNKADSVAEALEFLAKIDSSIDLTTYFATADANQQP